jgi:hypothetical protein
MGRASRLQQTIRSIIRARAWPDERSRDNLKDAQARPTRFRENSHLGRKAWTNKGGPGPGAPRKGSARGQVRFVGPVAGVLGAAWLPALLFYWVGRGPNAKTSTPEMV